jgi:ribosomal protein RSM22 (predicted rRNA methylase)
MDALQLSINRFLEQFDIKTLIKSSESLTACYRAGGSLRKKEDLIAYLTVRLPATYAALKETLIKLNPGSLLDLGAGPGSAWWAAQAVWGPPFAYTAYEREAQFISLGKQLGTEGTWKQGNILNISHFDAHDWVLLSYLAAELPEETLSPLLDKCWKAAIKGIVLIEPGTPQGYQRMLLMRKYLIQLGGKILAPCPHALACPLKTPDWCHFFVRLERSYLHRQAKHASLAFEDEKFTYLIVIKETPPSPTSRIIRPPVPHSGHITLPLCTPNGLQNLTVSRSQKEVYKKARKSRWGDLF